MAKECSQTASVALYESIEVVHTRRVKWFDRLERRAARFTAGHSSARLTETGDERPAEEDLHPAK